MNDQPNQRTLTTADMAAASEAASRAAEPSREQRDSQIAGEGDRAGNGNDQLAPLFTPDVANGFRSRWNAVQSSFVDDPKEAVRHGDELVAQVMQSLAETFSNERSKLESQFENKDQSATENL